MLKKFMNQPLKGPEENEAVLHTHRQTIEIGKVVSA
jgi:hypothetical protein